jgi:putative membrane fusion protein
MEKENGRAFRWVRHIPAALLCAVVIVYCAYHLIVSLVPGPELLAARMMTYTETVTLDGYLLLSEQVLVSPAIGEPLSIRADGERVPVGGEVARVYTAVSQEAYDELTELRRRISILERATTTYTSIKNAPQVLSMIEENLLRYHEAVHNNEMVKALSLRDTILAARAQYQALIGGYSSYEDTIRALKARATVLEDGLGTVVASVYADVGGYYYRSVDGYESIFAASAVDSLTVDDFHQMKQAEPAAYIADSRTAGKLVTDHSWYTVVETDSGTASAFTSGRSYNLRFLGADRTLSMKLYRTVTSSREDAVLLIFVSNRVSSDFDYTRSQRVEITAAVGEGYAVPQKAVRNINGQTGVYVLDRYVVRFRRISILGEENGMYICDPTLEGEDCLKLYDSIIVEGRNLYDGKVYN